MKKPIFFYPKRKFESFKKYSSTFRKESDRACAIMAEPLLDSMLEELLKRTMVAHISKRIFDQQGPLSTFSNKTELSFALGLISKHEYSELNTIRRIRNRFAHSKNYRLRFSSSSNQKLLSNLKLSKFLIELSREVFPPNEFRRKYPKSKQPRIHFELSFGGIAILLRERINQTKRPRVKKGVIEILYDNPSSPLNKVLPANHFKNESR